MERSSQKSTVYATIELPAVWKHLIRTSLERESVPEGMRPGREVSSPFDPRPYVNDMRRVVNEVGGGVSIVSVLNSGSVGYWGHHRVTAGGIHLETPPLRTLEEEAEYEWEGMVLHLTVDWKEEGEMKVNTGDELEGAEGQLE